MRSRRHLTYSWKPCHPRRTAGDPRQIVVRGIPPAVRLEPLSFAAALLTALKLEMHVLLVVKWRAWNTPAREQQPLHTPTTTSDARVPATALRTLVFTLASPEARDDILRTTSMLKDLHCQAIFGVGGSSKLSVNGIWPEPVHKLLKHASAHYKRLGHLRPVVKNLTVYMRPTKNGPLLPVTREADIDIMATARPLHYIRQTSGGRYRCMPLRMEPITQPTVPP